MIDFDDAPKFSEGTKVDLELIQRLSRLMQGVIPHRIENTSGFFGRQTINSSMISIQKKNNHYVVVIKDSSTPLPI
jgi:hypothetical protein